MTGVQTCALPISLTERFCVWAAFCGAALLITLWSALPLPFASAFFIFLQVFSSLSYFELSNLCFFMGWGAVQGITNNLAGRPLGCGFVLWAVLCGHAPLPERFCVWTAFCGAVLLTTLWSALPSPFAYAFFSSPFKSLSL